MTIMQTSPLYLGQDAPVIDRATLAVAETLLALIDIELAEMQAGVDRLRFLAEGQR